MGSGGAPRGSCRLGSTHQFTPPGVCGSFRDDELRGSWARFRASVRPREGVNVGEAGPAVGLMTLRQYARSRRQRGLVGGSPSAVHRAVRSGRIERDPATGLLDAAAADAAWSARTDPVLVPASAGTVESPAPESESEDDALSLPEARRREAIARAKLRELELARAAGELVDARTVERRAFEIARMTRDRLLSIPSRLAGELAPDQPPVEIERRLRSALTDALQELVTNIGGRQP